MFIPPISLTLNDTQYPAFDNSLVVHISNKVLYGALSPWLCNRAPNSWNITINTRPSKYACNTAGISSVINRHRSVHWKTVRFADPYWVLHYCLSGFPVIWYCINYQTIITGRYCVQYLPILNITEIFVLESGLHFFFCSFGANRGEGILKGL